MYLLLTALIFSTFCNCDDHVYGTFNSGDKLLFHKVLFDHQVPHSKNYTLIFKYIGAELSPNIAYAKFEVNSTTSQGVIDVNIETNKEKTLQAQINIINGKNVHVVGKIYGPSVNILDADNLMKFGLLQSTPRTVTIVYGHNATRTRDRKVILGHRQQGDKLIDFQTKNVTFSYRFPETEFIYQNNRSSITSVGFSLDSPTAVIFANSTFLNEHGINAIAYDLNSPFFKANMSVYGYENNNKPESYRPMVTVRKH